MLFRSCIIVTYHGESSTYISHGWQKGIDLAGTGPIESNWEGRPEHICHGECWFGSIVVSSNLTPWTVSVHLALAFAIVLLLTYCTYEIMQPSERLTISPNFSLMILLLLSVQIYLGIIVRSQIDVLAGREMNRSSWIGGAEIGRAHV